MGTISSQQKPEHETQVRPLVGLTPDQAQRAWQHAAQKAGARKITERMVKGAVNELGFAPQKQSGSAPVRTAKFERRLLITRTISELLKLISDKAAHDLLLEKACALVRAFPFVEVGLALARVRDLRLYRAEFQTFEAYCRTKWHYGRRYVNQLISAAQVFTEVFVSAEDPRHELQLRPLVGLSPEQARLAWERAAQNAGKGRITARLASQSRRSRVALSRTPAVDGRHRHLIESRIC